ncbi:FAD-binding oxidoreductase [Hoyosella subflava]|uniref:FAD linked oxidase domain protein n=1 Tax=Hoyosella subflava (strain DSM 45089 / JCM 17490 / NBRC 109087 / DQS3-9A1) TaxID=443218 RepID=F6EIY6_HOYSD|nr:FAD-binding oxidoreductase [Hoyosella subflava]AEF40047.1 FAD linked oxidase domain protein [Hoyosella subflava DQS3-9A1]
MAELMHWSRWGDPAHRTELPESAWKLLELAFGPPRETPAVPFESLALSPPALPPEVLSAFQELLGAGNVLLDDTARVQHTRGKSTPDLLKIRGGDLADAPDAVLRPGSHSDVTKVLELCAEHRVAVVPFGGGTSVVGGLAARRDGFGGVVTLDMARLDRLVSVDKLAGVATLEAGLLGPRAEELLAAEGFTLGHFPQSFEYASIGGFAATRSSGQASSGYGRFDAMVVGLKVATPIGTLVLGSAPANAAGPDLRQLVLGSEGAFGVITEVTLRVHPVPDVRIYETWRFGSFAAGRDAMRKLTQDGLRPTVIRLSDEAETAINLAKPSEVGSSSTGGCLMVAGYEGAEEHVARIRGAVTAELTARGGEALGAEDGQQWADGRFHGPYLRDVLLDHGVLVETLETATFWSNMDALYSSVKSAIESSLSDQGTPAIVLCHISHVYETGASLYFTVAARQLDDPLSQWKKAKQAASDAMIASGATITHHHAIGRDHKPWFAQEIGPVGVDILRAVKGRVDPAGILNPGVLIP